MRHIDILRANLGAELGRRGLKNTHAAAAIGIKPNSLRAKLKGERRVTLDEVIGLASWLDVPVSNLLQGLDEAEELHPKGREDAKAVTPA